MAIVLEPVRATPSGVRLNVRVIPRASKPGVAGIRDGRLVVRVGAAPVDAAANDAVVALLAEVFGVPKRGVRIVAGQAARNKIVDVDGLAAAAAVNRIAATVAAEM